MGKREKYKAKEDNRDIFDKALDYAPLVGAAVGARLGYKKMKVPHGESAHDAAVQRSIGAIGGGAAGVISGGLTKAYLQGDYGPGRRDPRIKKQKRK